MPHPTDTLEDAESDAAFRDLQAALRAQPSALPESPERLPLPAHEPAPALLATNPPAAPTPGVDGAGTRENLHAGAAPQRAEAESGAEPSLRRPANEHISAAPVKRTAPQGGGHGTRNLILGGLILLVGAGIWWGLSRKPAEKKGPGGPGQFPVPIVAGAVAQKDVPIYLDGLGTIQALNTVTVHVRVDGELKKLNFTEGQDVHAGDVLAQIDDAPLKATLQQAEARKAQDEAQLANARLDLARDVDLIGKKVISPQQYDSQKAMVAQLDATTKADQAAIESARVQLNYAKVVSPIDGRVGIRQIDQGNIVHANDPNGLVVITQLQPISLVFTLPEQNLGVIHKEQGIDKGELTVLAVDRDNQTTLDTGTLTVIDNQIDTSTGTIKLKATFPNEKFQLWPGQFCNARLLLTTRKNGLVVPASVIQRGPQGSYAFVIKDDNSVEIRPVKVARIEAGEALIDEGLAAGERVVVDGQYKLQPGSKVKIPDPNAKPGGPGGGPGDKARAGGKPHGPAGI